MISRQFLKSSLIYSVVGALPFVSGIVLMPFFTNLLTAQQFGANALFFGFLTLIQIITSFSLDFYVGVHYFDHKDDRQGMGVMMGTALTILGILGISMLLFMVIFGKTVFSLAFSGNVLLTLYPYGICTIFNAIFNGFFKTYTNLLINQQRPERFFWLNVTNFVMVMTLSLILLQFFPHTLTGPIFGRLIPSFISFIIVIILMMREFDLKWQRELLKGVISFCFPLLVYSLAIWTVNNIDRYIILHKIGDIALVGIYDFAVKVTLIIELLQVGINSTIQPKIYSIWKGSGSVASSLEVNRYYNGMISASILVIPCIVIAAPLLIPLIITKQFYLQGLIFIPVLALSFATRGWFYLFMAPLFYFKKTRVLPRIFTISAVIQLGMTILFIRYFGIWGAVWSNFLIKGIQAFLIYLEARKVMEYHVNKWKVFYLPVIFIFVFLAIQYLGRDLHPVITAGIQLIMTAMMVIMVYRRELIPLFRKIVK